MEECVFRYFMGPLTVEKVPFRYKIPRNPATCQISPNQLFLCGGTERGTRNTPSKFAGIFDFNTGDIVTLPEMNIPREECSVVFLRDHIFVLGGNDGTHTPTSTVERMHIAT